MDSCFSQPVLLLLNSVFWPFFLAGSPSCASPLFHLPAELAHTFSFPGIYCVNSSSLHAIWHLLLHFSHTLIAEILDVCKDNSPLRKECFQGIYFPYWEQKNGRGKKYSSLRYQEEHDFLNYHEDKMKAKKKKHQKRCVSHWEDNSFWKSPLMVWFNKNNPLSKRNIFFLNSREPTVKILKHISYTIYNTQNPDNYRYSHNTYMELLTNDILLAKTFLYAT